MSTYSTEGCPKYTILENEFVLDALLSVYLIKVTKVAPLRFYAHTLLRTWKSGRVILLYQWKPLPSKHLGRYYPKQPAMMLLGIGVVWYGERGEHMCGGRREIGATEGCVGAGKREGSDTLGLPKLRHSMDFAC
jgi:hypothetical protein